jgi:hypothetical protein
LTPRQVTVELLPDELAELERRAAARGISPNDYLRRSLADERFFEDQIKSGGNVLVRRSDGSLIRVYIGGTDRRPDWVKRLYRIAEFLSTGGYSMLSEKPKHPK